MCKQLPFFPTPYPDELLYSVFARYHLRSGNSSYNKTMNQLFGCPQKTAMIEMPDQLDALAARLLSPAVLPVDKLIKDHTLLPYYIPFIPEERAKEVIELMHSGNTAGRRNISSILGFFASKTSRVGRLRFCPECLTDDCEKYGEPYWHRSHQMFEVYRCHIHKCWLHESTINIGSSGARRALVALERDMESAGPCISDTKVNSAPYDWLAKSVHWLLNNNPENRFIPSHIFRDRYQILLLLNKLVSGNGRANIRMFLDKFTAFYGKEFLDKLRCSVDKTDRYNRLLLLFRKNGNVFNPLYHLLVLQFFDVSLECMLQAATDNIHPFGDAPWPCLNQSAGHYHQPVVEHCNIIRAPLTEAVTGVFSCECGFSYERTGPDSIPQDRYRFDKIVTTGSTWDRELLRLVSEGSSFREAGRSLGVSQNIIARNIGRLAEYPSGIPVIDELLEKREYQRKRWLELCALYPGDSNTELKKKNSNLFIWLNSNDNDWFNCNSSKIIKPRKRTVDWVKRDTELAEAVFSVAETMKSGTRRITVYAIAKAIGKIPIIQEHLGKLPKTKAALESVVETTEESVMRRITNTVGDFMKCGAVLDKYELEKASGVSRKSYGLYESVINQIICQATDQGDHSLIPAIGD